MSRLLMAATAARLQSGMSGSGKLLFNATRYLSAGKKAPPPPPKAPPPKASKPSTAPKCKPVPPPKPKPGFFPSGGMHAVFSDLPKPEGDFMKEWSAKNSKYSMFMLSGLLALIGSIYLSYMTLELYAGVPEYPYTEEEKEDFENRGGAPPWREGGPASSATRMHYRPGKVAMRARLGQKRHGSLTIPPRNQPEITKIAAENPLREEERGRREEAAQCNEHSHSGNSTAQHNTASAQHQHSISTSIGGSNNKNTRASVAATFQQHFAQRTAHEDESQLQQQQQHQQQQQQALPQRG
ncbi:GL11781 [Drosophila persimilis]|uniref:GL11781 n=1 Tax=Drosophila persimilis TaxID=7234 RepID=B4H6X6_DROPE|nr:GL11781 [Drosophila persimilis]